MIRPSTTIFFLIASTGKALATIDIGNVPENLGGGEVGSETLTNTVTDITVSILKFMALIATIVIIIAGIRMVISSGDEQGVEKAKKTLLWAVVGLILILLAGAIVSFVSGIFAD